MNDYEIRRAARIQANQALLAKLDIKPVIVSKPRSSNTSATTKPSPSKRRKLSQPQTAPSRASARIAAAPAKPTYKDEADVKAVALPRSASKSRNKGKQNLGSVIADEPDSLVPIKDVESIRAGWTAWSPVAPSPIRDDEGTFHFESGFEDFLPNKSPAEMLREGCFGGSYYRPLRSRKLGVVIEDDWRELPTDWIQGLEVGRYLTNPVYDADVNKFKVACGQSIEEWEAAGWISHSHDVRGWFQWYTRFFQGRRCEDDGRQVSRWKKCVGSTGRWRRMLLKKYRQMGVRDVFDDGGDVDEEGVGREVSPVMHQTCHQWAFEVRQRVLDEFWAEVGG